MLVLALESSAKAASVALMQDDALICQYSQCSGLTHSRTLLPMVEDMLKIQILYLPMLTLSLSLTVPALLRVSALGYPP